MQFSFLKNWGTFLLLLQVSTWGQLLFSPLSIAQESSTSSPKVIYFGYERNSYPISFEEDSSIKSDTFCYYLLDHLQQNYHQFTFKAYPINPEKRFSKIQDNNIILDMSCGSYSITPKRQKNLLSINSGFSIPFWTTGFNYIVRREHESVKQALINKQTIDINQKIAVIEGTTPYDYLMNTHTIYRKNIKSFKNKQEMINALKKDNTIVAYISDEILLKGILVKEAELQNKYELLNPNSINNRDEMGIIIYNYTPEINDMINCWLLSEGKTVIKNIDNYLEGELSREKNILSLISFTFFLIIMVFVSPLLYLIIFNFNTILKAISRLFNFDKKKSPQNPDKLPNSSQPNPSTSQSLTQIFHIGGNTMNNSDQSQKLSIGGNVSDSSINQESNATINIDSNNLTQQDITKALADLENLIQQENSLTPENKTEALEEIENIKEASQDPKNEQLKKQAKSSWKVLKGMADGLKTTNETIKQFKDLLPIIQSFFGF